MASILPTKPVKHSIRIQYLDGMRGIAARPVVGLGRFSYSLYLMHAPLLALMTVVADSIGLTGYAAYAFILVVGVPWAVFGAYVFHRLFERPFMAGHAFERPAQRLPATRSLA